MLRIHPIADAQAAESYYSKADGGYYLGDHDLHCEWGGAGAARLGLAGRPDYEHFRNLINGLDPYTGKQLTAKLVENRVPGWDITISVPKGVTIALENGDSRIQEALWSAARETMAEIEQHVLTRVRSGGQQDDRATGNLVWYAVEHPETRPAKDDGMPDPDRHIHFVVMNVTWDQTEEKWKAVKFRPVMEDRKWFDRRFDSRVASKLTDLGYQIETKWASDGHGGKRYFSWDIKDMPAVQKFSRRTGEVEQLADQLGVRTAQGKDKLAATSRQFKRKDMTLADYRAYWAAKLTDKERDGIQKLIASATPRKRQPLAEQALGWAVDHHFERESVVPLKKLEITAMERGMGASSPEEVAKAVKRMGLLVKNGEATTRDVLEQEGRIISFAREGRGTMRPLAKSELSGKDTATLSPEQQAKNHFGDINKMVSLTHQTNGQLDGLSPEQQAICRHVWESAEEKETPDARPASQGSFAADLGEGEGNSQGTDSREGVRT